MQSIVVREIFYNNILHILYVDNTGCEIIVYLNIYPTILENNLWVIWFLFFVECWILIIVTKIAYNNIHVRKRTVLSIQNIKVRVCIYIYYVYGWCEKELYVWWNLRLGSSVYFREIIFENSNGWRFFSYIRKCSLLYGGNSLKSSGIVSKPHAISF